MGEPLIKIPEKDAPLAGMPPDVKNRFDKIDTILVTVVAAVVIALISIVIAVFGIFLDQMRYNNIAYKEYSQKIESVETVQKTNEALLKQVQDLSVQDKKNQELIIGLQKQILQK